MKSLVNVVAAVVIFVIAGQITASVVAPLSTQDLGSQASLIVVGRVIEKRSYWNDDRTRIETEIQLQVEEMFKGSPVDVVRVVQPGGVVDNVRVMADGVAVWTVGEEVLLFLEPHRGGTHHVVGLNQGQFAVDRDEGTDEAWVRAKSGSRKLASVRSFVAESMSSQQREEGRK